MFHLVKRCAKCEGLKIACLLACFDLHMFRMKVVGCALGSALGVPMDALYR